MKDSDIKWEYAPTDTAVWIQDNDTVNGSDFSGWFNDVNDKGQYYECGSGSYVRTRNDDMFSVHHRPEQPTKAEEWVPVVGEECEGLLMDKANNSSWVAVKLLYNFDGEWAIQKVEAGTLAYCDQFRPLKTAEEKKREEFIECVKKLFPKSDTDDLILAGKLFGAGFTAPKGGE
tara:strand:+ start:319 stop:840 length:522 start_codon:yes stop_codon:yes gene_type:complete